MFRFHTSCRSCGNQNLIPVFDLGLQVPANSFRTVTEEQDGFAPLQVVYCDQCRLGQLSIVVDPKILYSGYPYVTSPSETMREHINDIFHHICAEISPHTNSPMQSVFEIGSNDGTLLAQFKKLGAVEVMGMEPASNLADIANKKGIRTINKFFNSEKAILSKNRIGTPDVIIARHVFCHIDDWHDFIKGLEVISKKDTLVCIEVPYAGDTLKNCEFDQVYFEHLSFLSIHSIEALLENTKFHLHKVTRYPIHGGAIMLYLRRNEWEGDLHPSIAEFLGEEETTITEKTWKSMAVEAQDNMVNLRLLLEDLVVNKDKIVCGMGASAKSSVWIGASGIGKYLSFIADETPQKQKKFSPGTRIPILSEATLIEENPDYIVLFAWNWKNVCMEKYPQFKGRWIVPVPKVEIV